jgi:hypothetical protein
VSELADWRDRWTWAGFPAIPLLPNTKNPKVCEGWQTRPPAELWHEATQKCGDHLNIGVRMGNGNAVIDCDAPKTRQTVEALFSSLGIDPMSLPVTQTATPGHCQYYIRVTNITDTHNLRHLPAQETGPGELRFGPGAQCATVCSTVDNRRYRFERGGPESIPTLKPIRWRDLEVLLAKRAAQAVTTPAVETTTAITGPWRCTPIPLLHRDMPAQTQRLLRKLETATVGQMVFTQDTDGNAAVYDSRSEAECAVVAGLILSGWDLGEIERAFYHWQPGHWREQPNRTRCLQREFDWALSRIVGNPTRRAIADLWQRAQCWPWPGRGGAMEKSVYLGLLSIGWAWESWQPFASQRDLAELAGTRDVVVGRALKRLQAGGLVEVMEPANRIMGLATRWDLSKHALTEISRGPTDKPGGTKPMYSERGSDTGALAGVVWARVGRSAGLAWTHLGDEPLDVGALAEMTGKCKRTVKSALGRLGAWDLVEPVEGGWVRSARSLQDVADEIDAAGRAKRRHHDHVLQREAWQEWHDRAADLGADVALEVQVETQVDEVQVDEVPLNCAWPWAVDR